MTYDAHGAESVEDQLESRIIAAIRGAGRAKLVNGTEPPFRGLPEPEIADMERVLDEVEILLPVLGFDVLRPAGHEAGTSTSEKVPPITTNPRNSEDVFIFSESGTNAKARESSGEFVVLAGSNAKRSEVQSCDDGLKKRRAQLVVDGILKPTEDGKFLVFTKDFAFDSPSGAARVVYGGNVSGPRHWRHSKTGQRYGEWRASLIGERQDS